MAAASLTKVRLSCHQGGKVLPKTFTSLQRIQLSKITFDRVASLEGDAHPLSFGKVIGLTRSWRVIVHERQ